MISNPVRNALHDGLPLEDLKQLVRHSGYPLQAAVAKAMQEHFNVTEEWGYPDRNTQEHRSLDVYGFKILPEQSRNGRPVRTYVVLLVECKQSVLPYFFFQSVTYEDRPIPMFPTIAGSPVWSLQSVRRPARSLRPNVWAFIPNHSFNPDRLSAYPLRERRRRERVRKERTLISRGQARRR